MIIFKSNFSLRGLPKITGLGEAGILNKDYHHSFISLIFHIHNFTFFVYFFVFFPVHYFLCF